MNKKGFTLTEMMIVVIIISGLMFLIIPNILNSKDKIETKTCDAYIELVDSQIQAYILDHDTSPESIEILVTDHYIKSNKCPSGEVLIIVDDKAQKGVVTTP